MEQSSIHTRRIDRNETLSRGVGAGLGSLFVAHTSKALPFLKEIAAQLAHLPPPSWTTFLIAAIPNAVANLAYKAAEQHLASTYTKAALKKDPDFHTVVLYGTSALCFAASAVLVANISGIALMAILGCSTVGWIANQVIHVACMLFHTFEGSQKEISEKIDVLLKGIHIKPYSKGTIKELHLEEEFPESHLLPIDIELWEMLAAIPYHLATSTAYGLDFCSRNSFSSIEKRKFVEIEVKSQLMETKISTEIKINSDTKKQKDKSLRNYKPKQLDHSSNHDNNWKKHFCPKLLNYSSNKDDGLENWEDFGLELIKNFGDERSVNKSCECLHFNDPQNYEQLSEFPKITPTENFKGIRNINNSCYQNSAARVLINLFNHVKEDGFKIYEMIYSPEAYAKKRIEALNTELELLHDKEKIKKLIESQRENQDFIKTLKSKEIQIASKIREENELKEIVEKNIYKIGIKEDNAVLMIHLNDLANSNTKCQHLDKPAHIYLQVLQSFQQMINDQKTGIKDETSTSLREAVYQLHFRNEINTVEDQQDSGELLNFLTDLLGTHPLPLQEFCSYELNKKNETEVNEYLKSLNVAAKELCEIPKYEEQKYQFASNLEKQPFDLAEKNNNPLISRSINPQAFIGKKTTFTLKKLIFNAEKAEQETFYKGNSVVVRDKENLGDKTVSMNYPHVFPDWEDYNDKNGPYYKFGKQIQVIETNKKSYLLSDDVPQAKCAIFEVKRYTGCRYHNSKKHHLQVMPEEVIEIPIFDQKEKKETGSLKMTLMSAIVHPWGSINGGHYISYAREEDGWYLYDDEKVEKVVDEKQMLNQMSVNGTIFVYAISN